jgi:MFS family permease
MLPILLLHNLTWVAIFLSLAFFSKFTIGSMWAIPMDIAPRFSGSAGGLMNTGSALAAIVSPLVFGYVIDKTGDWTLPFLGSIGLLLIGAMPAFWMKPDEELPGAGIDRPARSESGKVLKQSHMETCLSSFILLLFDPI